MTYLSQLSEWKAKVLLFMHKIIHVSFVVQTSFNSSLFLHLGDLDHLKILRWSLVIAYMDNHSNNFVFVCKKFYVSSLFFELNSHIGTYVAFDLAQYDILKFHHSFNKAHNSKGEVWSSSLVSLCCLEVS
jgi:hypothetical protein